VYAQFWLYYRNSSELSQYYVLDRLLTRDMAQARELRKTPHGFEALHSDKVVRYEALDQYVLRYDGGCDTFAVRLQSMSCFFNGQAQHLPQGLVDRCVVAYLLKEQETQCQYRKEYGAEVFINEKP
jgi:hypothetical protein